MPCLENRSTRARGLQGPLRLAVACGPLVSRLFILSTKTMLTSPSAAPRDSGLCVGVAPQGLAQELSTSGGAFLRLQPRAVLFRAWPRLFL